MNSLDILFLATALAMVALLVLSVFIPEDPEP